MNYIHLEKKAANFITSLFASHNNPGRPFYNVEHTQQVVLMAKEMAWFYSLDEISVYILSMASWFIYTGRLIEQNGNANWKEKSAAILGNFLETDDIPVSMIKAAQACVIATATGPNLHSLPEKIICDASTWYYGAADFDAYYIAQQKEQSDPDFIRQMLHKLQEHLYFTEYCQLLLNKGKYKNIAWLREKISATNV